MSDGVMSKVVTYRADGPVATLVLNRPEKRNALNAAMVTALKEGLDAAQADDAVRVVVLTGAGSAFSAGADLSALRALRSATPMENRADSARLADLFKQIYTHPKPVIAKINGHAIAGGSGLASVCDLSLAVEGAKMGFTEVRIGFVPAIVMIFVRRKLGETATRDLLLRGRLITTGEAARLGLITRTVPPDELDAEVHALAHEMARETSGSALALTKRLLAQVDGMSLDEALSYATDLNALARSTADCQAGIDAFLNKTDPPWKARAEQK